MKKLFCLALVGVLLSVFLTGCGGHTDKKDLIVGMELAYPPFETTDEAGNPSGVSVDLANAFGEYEGRNVEIKNLPWEDLIPALENGSVDMVVSSMTITDERKKAVDFSAPYAQAALAILANKNAGVTAISDLNMSGKRIAVKAGSTGENYVKSHLNNAALISLNDEDACVAQVSKGTCDAFVYDQLSICRDWQANQDTTKAILMPFQGLESWGIAVKKGNTDLLTDIDNFLAVYKKEGGFNKLTEKHLKKTKKLFDELRFHWFFDV